MKNIVRFGFLAAMITMSCKSTNSHVAAADKAEPSQSKESKEPQMTMPQTYLGKLKGSTKDGKECIVWADSVGDGLELQFTFDPLPEGYSRYGKIHRNAFPKAVSDGKKTVIDEIKGASTGNFGSEGQPFFVPSKIYNKTTTISWDSEQITSAEVITEYPNGEGWSPIRKLYTMACMNMKKIK